jgi:hypothetical protein
VDRLDLLIVDQAQQPFARAVDRGLATGDRRPGDGEAVGQLLAQSLAKIAHASEVAGAAVVQPAPQLARTERRLAELGEQLRQLGAV